MIPDKDICYYGGFLWGFFVSWYFFWWLPHPKRPNPGWVRVPSRIENWLASTIAAWYRPSATDLRTRSRN